MAENRQLNPAEKSSRAAAIFDIRKKLTITERGANLRLDANQAER